MPQRDDTIEANKRRAVVKKAAEEKKKAEARARAAYRRKQRKLEENGLLEGFAQINWAFMAARDELKRRGFSLGRGRNGGWGGSDPIGGVRVVEYKVFCRTASEGFRGSGTIGGLKWWSSHRKFRNRWQRAASRTMEGSVPVRTPQCSF